MRLVLLRIIDCPDEDNCNLKDNPEELQANILRLQIKA